MPAPWGEFSITLANPPSHPSSLQRAGHRCGRRQRRWNRRRTILSGIGQPGPYRGSSSISASPGRPGQAPKHDEPPLVRDDSCLKHRESPRAAPFPATGGAGGAIRELYGGVEDFLMRNRRIDSGHDSRRYSRCRVGFPILRPAPVRPEGAAKPSFWELASRMTIDAPADYSVNFGNTMR